MANWKKIKSKFFAISCFVLLCKQSYAQQGVFFGAGGNFGYKGINSAIGFVLDLRFSKRISLYFGSADDKFSGSGIGGGINFHFSNSAWQPVLGCGYTALKSNAFYLGNDSLSRSDYFVPRAINFTPLVGLHRVIRFDDKTANNFISITPYLCYRLGLENNEVVLLDGIKKKSEMNRINSRTGDGWGFGIKVIYVLAKNSRIPLN